MPDSLRKSHFLSFLLLATLILLLAGGLRFHNLGTQSFWNDEGNSARLAERPFSQIVEGAVGDIHPPGYYLALAGWRVLVGESEFALRALSTLASLLTVAAVGAIGARLFDRRIGLLAALLAAVSPFQIYYAQEARMYALLALLAALSIRLTAAVLTIPGQMAAGRFNPQRAGAIIGGYVLVNAAGLYIHYSFPLVIGAETLAFVIWLLGRPRKEHGLMVWALLQGGTLLLFIPWLPTALDQLARWPRGLGGSVGALTLGRTLAYGVTLSPDMARSGLIPLLLIAAVGLFPPVNSQATPRYLRWEERLGLVASWLLVPLVLLVGLNVMSEPFLKFLLPAALALNLLVARGALMAVELSRPVHDTDRRSAALRQVVVAILLLAGLSPIWAGLRGLYSDPQYTRDDYRTMAARILVEAGPEAAVVLNAPNQWEVFTYYYPDGPNVTPLPNDTTEETLARLLDGHSRIYALFWGEAQQDPDRAVEQTLEANAFTLSAEWYGGVRFVTYAVSGEGAQGTLPGEARFGASIQLNGFSLSDTTLAPGEALGVSLHWATDSPLGERYKVFVHLYAPDGTTIVAQHDAEPGGGLTPTDDWTPGQMVQDNHGLLLPPEAAPGVYQLAVGLYDVEGDRLPVTLDGAPVGDRLTLSEVVVE
jgi:4-amino-4-deoxy-L-arabinose transferase-like glycosyltransferase